VGRLADGVVCEPALSSEPPVKRLTMKIPEPITMSATTALKTIVNTLPPPRGGGGIGCWYCGEGW
jgi:hypothetical protein